MEQKNNVWIIALTIIVTTVVVGGGVYLWQQNKVVQKVVIEVATDTAANKGEPKEPLTYSTSGVSVSVSKETAPFGFTADQLVSRAEECGNEQTVSYFNSIVSKFSGATRSVYNFKYTGASQGSDTFVVTLLPNKTGYSSLDEFKKDFDQCYAGGDAYPKMLNDDWILFVNSCGTGFSDGSGNPIGCQEVRDVIEPTLKLN